MKNKKQWTALFLSLSMCIGTLVGCGNQTGAENNQETKESTAEVSKSSETQQEEPAEDPFLTGEKPVIRMLFPNYTTDLREDPVYPIMKELSGYEVEYTYLPAENADQKLMMEVAAGEDYDLIRVQKTEVYNELDSKNALMDLTDLLNTYGQDILENVPAEIWSTVTNENGEITAVPLPSSYQAKDTLYGEMDQGLIFRTDILEELGVGLPTNLEELYDLMKAYTEKTGNPALTLAGTAWVPTIASAFGMENSSWYDVDGEMCNRVNMEGLEEYVAFMMKLYNEGLLDADFPINNGSIVYEKFANNSALCIYDWFYMAQSIQDAVALSNPDAELVMAPAFSKDKNSDATIAVSYGNSQYYVLTENCANPEHAIIYLNSVSQMDNFLKMYLGEENVSYEVRNGQYYPIFPAFSDYGNGTAFVGAGNPVELKIMWLARARKTDVIAKLFDTANENTEQYVRNDNYVGMASYLPAYKEYMGQLDTLFGDMLLQGVVEGTDAKSVVDEMISAWESNGGQEVEQELNAWWSEFKENVK